jgi:hypothetical protein
MCGCAAVVVEAEEIRKRSRRRENIRATNAGIQLAAAISITVPW